MGWRRCRVYRRKLAKVVGKICAGQVGKERMAIWVEQSWHVWFLVACFMLGVDVGRACETVISMNGGAGYFGKRIAWHGYELKP
jgi:hypothetical protein